MLVFFLIVGLVLSLVLFRSVRRCVQASRAIRRWVTERGNSVVRIESLRIFGPHYPSIREAFIAAVTTDHYSVTIVDPEGCESQLTLTVETYYWSAGFRSMHEGVYSEEIP